MDITLIDKKNKRRVRVNLYLVDDYDKGVDDEIYFVGDTTYTVAESAGNVEVSVFIDGEEFSLEKLSDFYGYVCLKVVVDKKVYFSRWIDVRINSKFYDRYIEAMYSYIEQNDQYFVGQLYNFNTVFPTENRMEFDNCIRFFEKIRDVYVYNYKFFSKNPITKTDESVQKEDFDKIQNIGDVAVKYILTHLDEVQKSSRGIKTGKGYVLPTKCEKKKISLNYDVYENRVIISFLQLCRSELKIRQKLLQKYLSDVELVEEYISIPQRIWLWQFKGSNNNITTLSNLIDEFEHIEKQYLGLFAIKSIVLERAPQMTKRVFERHHYQVVFALIQDCFSKYKIKDGALKQQKLNFCKSFKSSDLYEKYCLCKLLNYIKKKADCSFSVESKFSYCLQLKDFCVNVYFKPKICGKNIESKFDVYRNNQYQYKHDGGFRKIQKSASLEPDFIVRLSNKENVLYYILDAKFSTFDTVMKYSMPEVMIKYGVGVSVHSDNSSKMNVGIMYGKWECDERQPDFFVFPDDKTSEGTRYFAMELSPRIEEKFLTESLDDFFRNTR